MPGSLAPQPPGSQQNRSSTPLGKRWARPISRSALDTAVTDGCHCGRLCRIPWGSEVREEETMTQLSRRTVVKGMPPGRRFAQPQPPPWLVAGGTTLSGRALAVAGLQLPALAPEQALLLRLSAAPAA